MIAVAISSPNLQDTSDGLDQTLNEWSVEGTLTLTGNYGGAATHGDTISWSGLDLVKATLPPRRMEIFESNPAGTAPYGYSYQYSPGTSRDTGVVTILGGAAASGQGGTEITEGSAYSTFTPSLNNAVLRYKAFFTKFI